MSKIYSERKGEMVNKQREIEEITPSGWKKMTKERKEISKKRDRLRKQKKEDDGMFRAMFCLKKRQDMKIIEEKEDCFILDFDPDEGDLSSTADSPYVGDDVAIIHEKGEVACRDFPHSRHLCSKFPFGSTQHALHCNQCYCYVCDSAAPCPHWTCGYSQHCDALDDDTWKHIRAYHRKLAEELAASYK